MRSRVQLADRSKAAPSRLLYDEDFALWVDEQVAALRAGGMAALDVANLVAELEGLTKRDVRALGSQLERIMVHMLKRRYAPERASAVGPTRSRTVVRKSPTSWSRARACDAPCLAR